MNEVSHQRKLSQAVNVVHRWTGRPYNEVRNIGHCLTKADMLPRSVGRHYPEIDNYQFGLLILAVLACPCARRAATDVSAYVHLDLSDCLSKAQKHTVVDFFAWSLKLESDLSRQHLPGAQIEVYRSVPKVVVTLGTGQKFEFADWSSPEVVEGSDLVWRLSGSNLYRMHREFQPAKAVDGPERSTA